MTGDGRLWRRWAAACGLWLGLTGPAAAIVGGAEDAGPLARASVMVLSSKGGVCSGVVVAADVVLTAAHCIAGPAEHRVHYRAGDGSPVLIAPAAAAVHPDYVADAVARRRRSIDLALVRLPEPLPSRFASAALAATVTATSPGERLRVAGWGLAREKEARSSGTFRSVELAAVAPYGPSRVLVWATGGGGAGACHGDSGGPITAAGSEAVIAVITWATGEGRRGCGALSQGILLAPQRVWIDRILTGWSRAAAWR